MREIRLFGSEGGGPGITGPSYPYPGATAGGNFAWSAGVLAGKNSIAASGPASRIRCVAGRRPAGSVLANRCPLAGASLPPRYNA